MGDEQQGRAQRPREPVSPTGSGVSQPGQRAGERAGSEGRPAVHSGPSAEQDPATAGRRSKTLQTVTIVLLLLGLLTAIFVFQNTQQVTINFLAWSVDAPLAAVLLLAVVIGGLLAFLVAYIRQRQYRRAARREHAIHSP